MVTTDTLLIVDEVMTGFGRTGRMFDSEHEGVIPDMMVPGNGLTGRYLPIALTLISEKLFSAFNGSVAEGKALAYGHSYTGNALSCAAAKASLEVFEKEGVLEALQSKIRHGRSRLHRSPASRCSDQADLERRRPDAALVHHNRSANQGRGSPPRVDQQDPAVQ